MNNQEKNGTKGLIALLIAMALFAAYQVIVVPMLKQKEDKKESEQVKEEKVNLEEIGVDLYNKFTLTMDEEYGITSEDEELLSDKLSPNKMSDKLKINLGIKNVNESSIRSDGGYSLKEAVNNMKGNFYYSGKYITVSAVQDSMNKLFGSVPVEHQTITLRDNKYVYNESKKLYEIWILRKTPKYTEKKITYKEVLPKDDEILVYEYVAYTNYKDLNNLTTRTVHGNRIEIAITEENVQDYLNYMDKYRYTFKKNEDGNYYFVSVEYVQ